MSRAYACPQTTRLRQLLADDLEEDETRSIESHLEACVKCRNELEQLAGEGVPWIKIPGGVPCDETALRNLIESLRDETQVLHEKPSLDFLAASDNPNHLGKLGPYEATGVLGQGGFGIVLKAFDPVLLRVVAIKVLIPALATNPSARRRFVREAQAAAAVTHEHVVAIHAIEESAGLPYLVMPYIAGMSLQQRLDSSGALEVAEILRIGMQAASGLAAAHAQGLIHRDVKPANILLENGVQRVKLTDFGLARAVDDASLTQSGVLAGTPLYMAPEQARGEQLSPRADLFSLGTVLYALCTGRPPFRASSAMAILKRVCEDTPRPIREIRPEVPESLAAIVTKLLEKDPNDRFGSATELAETLGMELARLQSSASVAAAVPEPQTPAKRALPIQRWAAVAAVALIIIAGLGATKARAIQKVADYVATVLRIKTTDGYLMVQVDDPNIKVSVDGQTNELVVKGTDLIEFRLKPGRHTLVASRGQTAIFNQEITISRGNTRLVTISTESDLSAEKTTGLRTERLDPVIVVRPTPSAPIASLPTPRPGLDPIDEGAKTPPILAEAPPTSSTTVARLLTPEPPPAPAPRTTPLPNTKPAPGRSDGPLEATFPPRSTPVEIVVDVSENHDPANPRPPMIKPARSFMLPEKMKLLGARVLSKDATHFAYYLEKDESLVVVDLTTRTIVWQQVREQNQASRIAYSQFSPDGLSLLQIVRGDQLVLTLTELSTDRILWKRHDNSPEVGRPFYVRFSPDGSVLYTTAEDGILEIAIKTGKNLKRYTLRRTPSSFDVSPDGRSIIALFPNPPEEPKVQPVRWELATGKKIGFPIKDTTEFNSIRFLPDGRRIATSSGGGGMSTHTRICDIDTGELHKELSDVHSMAFSTTGLVAYLSTTKGSMLEQMESIEFFDLQRNKVVGKTAKLEDKAIGSMGFSADNKTLTTIDYEGKVTQWDVSSLMTTQVPF